MSLELVINRLKEKALSKTALWDQEDFQYVLSRPFQEIEEETVNKALDANYLSVKKPYQIVLIQGKFSKELSSLEGLEGKILLMDHEEAKQKFSSQVVGKYEKFLKRKELCQGEIQAYLKGSEGLFLYILPKAVIDRPLEILDISPRALYSCFGLHTLVFGKMCEVKIHYKVVDEGAIKITSSWDLQLEQHAKATFLVEDNGGVSPHLSYFSLYLKKNAWLDLTVLDKGSSLLRRAFYAELLEPEASVNIKGLSCLKEKKQSHIHALIKHLAPYCKSYQHFKKVLWDQTRASFIGKIWVEALADKTEAYQLCNQLLLSERAQGFTRPQLEIFADDVKASHGATVSKFDKEELFYLSSRGLNSETAEGLVLKGFCKEILDRFPEETTEQFLRGLSDARSS